MTSERRLAPWSAAVLMLAVLTSSIGRAVGQPTPPDVEALLTRLDGLYRSKSSIARIELQVTADSRAPCDGGVGVVRGGTRACVCDRVAAKPTRRLGHRRALNDMDAQRSLVGGVEWVPAVRARTDRTGAGKRVWCVPARRVCSDQGLPVKALS